MLIKWSLVSGMRPSRWATNELAATSISTRSIPTVGIITRLSVIAWTIETHYLVCTLQVTTNLKLPYYLQYNIKFNKLFACTDTKERWKKIHVYICENKNKYEIG